MWLETAEVVTRFCVPAHPQVNSCGKQQTISIAYTQSHFVFMKEPHRCAVDFSRV